MIIDCLILPGTQGENRFGEDPLCRKKLFEAEIKKKANEANVPTQTLGFRSLFSFKGRFSRKSFWNNVFFIQLAMIIIECGVFFSDVYAL